MKTITIEYNPEVQVRMQAFLQLSKELAALIIVGMEELPREFYTKEAQSLVYDHAKRLFELAEVLTDPSIKVVDNDKR